MLSTENTSDRVAGYQELGLSNLTGATSTGLVALTKYYFKINIDGAGVVEYDITTGATVTYNDLITLLNGITGTTWEIISGDLRCSSNTTGTTSSIALSAGTTGSNLFANLTGFSTFETAVAGREGSYVTITDVKKELEVYSFYDYATDDEFVDAIKYASEEAERIIKKYISTAFYNTIQAKNKTGLEEYIENHIYQAEVYMICSMFLSLHDRKELFKRKAANESVSEGNVTHSTSGPTGKAMASSFYYTKAMKELSTAGYDTVIRLGRNINSPLYAPSINDDFVR